MAPEPDDASTREKENEYQHQQRCGLARYSAADRRRHQAWMNAAFVRAWCGYDAWWQ